MTIAIGVACPEGLVFAADSRSSLLSANKFRIATDHAQKVFEIGDRFAAVTFGWSDAAGEDHRRRDQGVQRPNDGAG